jgi:hypothetical protein
MTTLTKGFEVNIELPAQWTLSATAAVSSSGRILRLRADSGGDISNPVSLAAGETKSIGPFTAPASCRVICHTGSLTYTIRPSYSGDVTSTDVASIVKLTQAEYDALETPDATTLYVIVG